MLSFRVSLNDRKLCLAGVGERGVLSAIVSWAAGDQGTDLFLNVAGLATEELIDWIVHQQVQVGDEIRIQICDANSVDDPIRKRRRNAAETLDGKKRAVRLIAKELGLKIQTDPDDADQQSTDD